MSVHPFPGVRRPTSLRIEAVDRWWELVHYVGRERRPIARFGDRTTAAFCGEALAKRDGLALQPEAEF